MVLKRISLLIWLPLLLCGGWSFSQSASMAAGFRVSVSPEGTLKVGQEVTLTIEVTPKKGWHVYSALPSTEGAYMPAEVAYDLECRGFSADSILSEKGPMISMMDEMMGGVVRYYERPVTYSQKITLTEPEIVISGSFDFMACDEMKCLPLSETFQLKLIAVEP